MNVQEQIKEWYQDRRFVNYVNMRVQEEIRHVSEQRPDQSPATRQVAEKQIETQAWHLVGVCADSHTETLYGNHHQGV